MLYDDAKCVLVEMNLVQCFTETIMKIQTNRSGMSAAQFVKLMDVTVADPYMFGFRFCLAQPF